MDGLAPYRLKLRVKFFVEPHLILQEQTRYSGWHQPMSKGSLILIFILLYFFVWETHSAVLWAYHLALYLGSSPGGAQSTPQGAWEGNQSQPSARNVPDPHSSSFLAPL